jgi:hypothetical protein
LKQHRQAGNGLGLGEAMPGLVEHADGDHEQQHRVGDGCQYLGTVEPERLGGGGWPRGDLQRQQRHREPEDVRQHVTRIGQQRQRSGE